MKLADCAHPADMTPERMRFHIRACHGTWITQGTPVAEMSKCHKVHHSDPDPMYDLEHNHRERGA